jgi:DNA-directed RNA polymerase subunit RPC12/RpoP
MSGYGQGGGYSQGGQAGQGGPPSQVVRPIEYSCAGESRAFLFLPSELHPTKLPAPTDCGADNQMRPNEPIRCKECGHRVVYKKRAKVKHHDLFSSLRTHLTGVFVFVAHSFFLSKLVGVVYRYLFSAPRLRLQRSPYMPLYAFDSFFLLRSYLTCACLSLLVYEQW